MKMPKMILFDYGQTLVNEQRFNGVRGTEAVLKYATKNKSESSLCFRTYFNINVFYLSLRLDQLS